MSLRGLFFIISGGFLFALVNSDCGRGDGNTMETDSLLYSAPVAAYTDSIRMFPGHAPYYFERGGILYSLHHYDLARKDLEKAVQLDSAEAAYSFALAEINAADDEWQAALEGYRRSLRHQDADQQVRLRMAFVLFQQKQYEQTLKQLDTLLERFPAGAQAYGLQARTYEAMGDTARALEKMRKAVKADTANYDALMGLGDLLSAAGRQEALTWYDKASRLDTTQAEPLYAKAQFYENSGLIAKAVSTYQACITTDRYYLKAYIRLSELFGREDHWEKAWSAANLAIRVDPAYSDAFYQRGLCNERLSRKKEAIEDYQRALALDKTNKKATLALQKLQSK